MTKKGLRIAQIAPLWFPIPPPKYGGTERIVHLLTESLTERGHKVTLFASGDSKTKAKLFSVAKKGLISQGVPWKDFNWLMFNTSVAFEKAKEFDIIHAHWVILAVFFQRLVKIPVLNTLHNIPGPKDHRWKVFEYYKKDLNAIFVSQSEKRNCPIRFKNSWVVYNGIDLEQFEFNENPKDHFIWIGRVCQQKGIENAIAAAEKTGINLLLAGQIQESAKEYFKKTIKPHLSKKIKYVGELSQKQLSGFYRQAKALLYPIEWEEPFGLVMAESMACGTPVIVFNRGSAPEVVKDGKTGFVVKNIREMIKAIKQIDSISREDCRKQVEENFSRQKMIKNYEKIYYQVLKNKK